MADTPARYCSNCGHALNTGDRFCPNCGRPVQETATVPTPEADVPVPPPAQTGSFNTAAPQTSPRTSLRRELSDRRVAGGLIFLGVCFIGLCVAAATGNLDAQDVGGVAEEPKQERQAAQQEQPQKRDPQPQEEEQQAQGGQKEQQDDGGQEPEPPKPEPQKPEPQEPSFASFGDGTYQVGTDVQPGTYRTREGSPYCYWERLRNFSGGMNGILANGGTGAPGIVTISPTDAGFHSEGCGTWTKDLSAITTSKTSFGAGAYIVGTDIDPGTFRNSGGRNCYWERLRGFNGGMNAIIANGGTSNPSIVTISPTDAGFQSNGCGTWTKLQ